MKLLRPFLAKLSPREKMAVSIGICFVGIFIIMRFVLFPFVDTRDRLRRGLAVHSRNYDEITLLKSKYLDLQQRAANSKLRFDRRKRGFTLYSFLEKLAGQVGINKERIIYMKPTSSKQKDSPYTLSLVEMKLEGISLEQITRFLYRVETSNNMINVRRLSLNKKEDKGGLLNIILQVETFEV